MAIETKIRVKPKQAGRLFLRWHAPEVMNVEYLQASFRLRFTPSIKTIWDLIDRKTGNVIIRHMDGMKIIPLAAIFEADWTVPWPSDTDKG